MNIIKQRIDCTENQALFGVPSHTKYAVLNGFVQMYHV